MIQHHKSTAIIIGRLDGQQWLIQSDDTVDTLTRRIQLQEYALLPYVIDSYETPISEGEGQVVSAVGARHAYRGEEYSSRGHREQIDGGGWRRLDYGS